MHRTGATECMCVKLPPAALPGLPISRDGWPLLELHDIVAVPILDVGREDKIQVNLQVKKKGLGGLEGKGPRRVVCCVCIEDGRYVGT